MHTSLCRSFLSDDALGRSGGCIVHHAHARPLGHRRRLRHARLRHRRRQPRRRQQRTPLPPQRLHEWQGWSAGRATIRHKRRHARKQSAAVNEAAVLRAADAACCLPQQVPLKTNAIWPQAGRCDSACRGPGRLYAGASRTPFSACASCAPVRKQASPNPNVSSPPPDGLLARRCPHQAWHLSRIPPGHPARSLTRRNCAMACSLPLGANSSRSTPSAT